MQALPPLPQAALLLPGSHPADVQHPVGQVFALQANGPASGTPFLATQWPFWQV
jgi:hypothetical protein